MSLEVNQSRVEKKIFDLKRGLHTQCEQGDGSSRHKNLARLLLLVVKMKNSLLREAKFDNHINSIKPLISELDDPEIENAVNELESLKEVDTLRKTGNYSFFSNGLTNIANKNRNLALLLANKLIVHLKQERVVFQKFIEYCSSSINDKMLSIPFQIEHCILKEDWINAILRLKEAVKFNIFLPFDHKEMFAVFYCALAKQYEIKGDFKGAIKSLFRAQSYYATFRPINYLKVELYIKLGKIRKASTVLEAEYAVNPTPQSAKMYINLNSKGAERLYNLRPDYYFSYCLLALSSVSSGKYDRASQYLDTAMKKANYMSIYFIVIQLKITLQEHDKVVYWLNKMGSEALPDPGWKCKNCNRELKQWDHQCSNCNSFNCVYYIL
ncbi:heme biosynthesis protein HemY [Nephila pilipes]|uniref:Heme biosynthesis protein HemY n=1 Tax=Nephila pilipes TaxID=299642 RepID=A0A8X6U3Y8_NEPPI|nr:heme biosynthesis protein HemY [Nephila pilipes]